jgi:hypothetical protein
MSCKKNKTVKKQLLAFTIALCLAFTVNAQNFTGHYVQQSKEMLDGIEYLNAIELEITITQTKDSIKIVRVTPDIDERTSTFTETLPVKGSAVIVTTRSKRKRTTSISFDNAKKTATIISTFSYAGNTGEIEYKNTEVWTLGDDGNISIVKTSDATETDDWTIKAVFKKI